MARALGSTALLVRLAKPKPTPVYDTYWRFAAERQEIFFRRYEGLTPPWTADETLARYKFTNVYRAADRVSQYLIRNVVYGGSQSPEDVVFRTLLFKLFNRIDTWEYLEEEIGQLEAATFSVDAFDRALSDRMRRGERVYSAAYIMPSGGRGTVGAKHAMHLALLKRMLDEGVHWRIAEAPRLEDVYAVLLGYPSIGPFLAYQYAVDLNYSELTAFDENEFVMAGPGARDGIRKCFTDPGGLNHADLIRFMADHQEEEFARLGIAFRHLWGRPLKLIDCQNVFCEVDKYARVRHPEIHGVSGRTRIKQQFRPVEAPIRYVFPPKWRLKIEHGNGSPA